MKKRIDIHLNLKSIDNARKEVRKYERQVKQAYTEFIEAICLWVIKRANYYIEQSDIGELVKLEISNAWEYTVSYNKAKIINTAKKAVFVEFGVGIVGEGNPHPNAGLEGYDYDIVTPEKDTSGMWYFWTNSNELDIPKSSIEDIRGYDDFRGKGKEQGKRIIVGTRGAVGVMYAYNALIDAFEQFKDPNSELLKEWKRLLERYVR